MFAIDASFGVASFAELRAKHPALRLATAYDDGVNMAGFARAPHAGGLGSVRGDASNPGAASSLLGEAPWDIVPARHPR